MDIMIFSGNILQVNTYFITEEGKCLLIDPGSNSEKIESIISKNHLKLTGIILTHAHFDHFLSCNYLNRLFDVPLYVHNSDIPLLYDSNKNMSVITGQELRLDESIKVIPVNEQTKQIDIFNFDLYHTPGHSPGGICIYFKENKVVFTGDTLFHNSIGRTDFDYGNEKQLITNIKNKLFRLPDDTVVYPGHGDETTIVKEKKHNPYIR